MRSSRALAAGLLLLTACGASESAERVTLPPGASFSAVTDTLVAHGVVGNRMWFKLLARVRGADRTARAGIYEFTPGLSAWKVLDILEKGDEVAVRFTVPEGLTIPEVAALAQEKLGIPADSVLAAAEDSAAASEQLGVTARSFEGFLRPETYSLREGTRARELVRVMAEGFRSSWKPEWDARLVELGVESAPARDVRFHRGGRGPRRRRARDHRRRLPQPAPYPDGAPGRPDRPVRDLPRDRQAASPALHQGLPVPVPVQHVPASRAAARTGQLTESAEHRGFAVPAKVPYLYFVAGPDGRHVFSKTYNEHLRAIANVRRGR